MSHYKPYPAYKDSGVEWLGKVPEHWSIRQLKSLARLTTGITPPTDNPDNYADDGFAWVRPEDLDELGRPTLASKFLSETGKEYVRQISEESSLICCIGTIGKVGYVDRAVSTNQQITSAEFHTSGRFFFYTLRASSQALDASAVGNVIRILNTDRLGSIAYPHPSTTECSLIAAHLDRETARIDALVEKKTRFIELLREKRQALITHAVTKGLDPNVKMKDSGVEWLGEVPEHWGVTTISRLFEIKAGGDLKESFFSDAPDEIHCHPIYTNSTKRDAVYGYTSKAFYSSNTITVTGRGEIGYAVYRDNAYDAIIRLLVLTPKTKAYCKYSAFFINAVLDFHGGNTAVSQLSAEQIAPYFMLSPPEREQVEISRYLDREASRIDTLIAKTDKSIALLKERRSALITAAVTGQIDLREAV